MAVTSISTVVYGWHRVRSSSVLLHITQAGQSVTQIYSTVATVVALTVCYHRVYCLRKSSSRPPSANIHTIGKTRETAEAILTSWNPAKSKTPYPGGENNGECIKLHKTWTLGFNGIHVVVWYSWASSVASKSNSSASQIHQKLNGK